MLLLLLVSLLSGCASPECELTTVALNLAGAGAEDCGKVALGEDGSAVDACAVAALQAGTPFVSQREEQGIDSQVTSAAAFDGTNLVSLYRDSDPSGGSGVGAVIWLNLCSSATVEPGDEGHDVVFCGEPTCSCELEGCADDGLAGTCCPA